MPSITCLPDLHAGQIKIINERRRFNVLAAGRRWSKSTTAQLLLMETAGQYGLPAAYFAPTYKLLDQTWRETTSAFGEVIRKANGSDRRFETITGGSAEFWTLEDRDAGRSRKYALAVIDEAGLVERLGESWHMAIRPTLADYEGAAWFLGTPRGRNFFHTVFVYGQDPTMPDWASWQMPTHTNPHIKPEEIEAMRQSMTERAYRQEILAEFLEDGGGVFRFVREAATSEAVPGAGVPGHQYVIGCDWGRENDATVYAVFDVSERRMVALDRMLRTDYALQRARLHALASRFLGAAILAESNSIGAPVIEALNREGLRVIPFTTTAATKAQIVDCLALALEQRSVRLLPDPVLIGELEAYESERLPSGLIRFSAPEGQHDDCVVAACLAWWQIAGVRAVWSGGNL